MQYGVYINIFSDFFAFRGADDEVMAETEDMDNNDDMQQLVS